MMQPGYRFIPMAEYLADPCPDLSLSTSTVEALIKRTPLHALYEHPKGGNHPSEESPRGDIGSAVHSLAIGGAPIYYLPSEFRNFKKKEAQTLQAEARARGEIPLVESKRGDVEAAAEAVRHTLEQFGDRQHEVTMCWQTEGVWCRGRADVLSSAYDIDIKTVSSADPHDFVRKTLYKSAYDIQMGLRSLGHEALGQPREMLWLLVEIEAPFAVSIVGMSPAMLDLAHRKVRYAAKLWRKCLDSDEWPGYSSRIHHADAEQYAEMDFFFRTGETP